MTTKEKYWEKRGREGYLYRNEYFYTITPIAFYYKRRERLLKNLYAELAKLKSGANILDFGCGDGFYSFYFKKQFPKLNFFGCDISETMIDKARELADEKKVDCCFKHSNSKIPFDKKFDLVIITAVFAHILDDNLLNTIVEDIYQQLAPNGKVVLFECTNKHPRCGKTWHRRTPDYYKNLFEKNNFKTNSENLISFPFYNWIGRPFLYIIVYIFFRGNFIKANSNKHYQKLTEIIINISEQFNNLFKSSEGNTFFIFEKQ